MRTSSRGGKSKCYKASGGRRREAGLPGRSAGLLLRHPRGTAPAGRRSSLSSLPTFRAFANPAGSSFQIDLEASPLSTSANSCPSCHHFPPGPWCSLVLAVSQLWAPNPSHTAARPVPWRSGPVRPVTSRASSALQRPCDSCLRTLAFAAPLLGPHIADGPSSKLLSHHQPQGVATPGCRRPTLSLLSDTLCRSCSFSLLACLVARVQGGDCLLGSQMRPVLEQGRPPPSARWGVGQLLGCVEGGGHSRPPLRASAKQEGRLQGPWSLPEHEVP